MLRLNNNLTDAIEVYSSFPDKSLKYSLLKLLFLMNEWIKNNNKQIVIWL